MPFVAALARQLEGACVYKGVPLTINHVIGTHYVTGSDGIGFHSDKTEDIQDGSPILMFSFRGRRELWFSTVVDETKGEKPEIVARFVMEPGSLFVLGPETNKLLKHGIVRECDEAVIDRAAEPLAPRISLVVRHISTHLSLRELWRRIADSKRGKVVRRAMKQQRAALLEAAGSTGGASALPNEVRATGTGGKRKRFD